MKLDNICYYSHLIVILAVLVGPFVVPLSLVKAYIVVVICIILQWYALNGKCVMTMMHSSSSSDNKGAIVELLEKMNIPLNESIIDAIIYFLLIYAFYRIKLLKEGILTVLTIILLNKAVFNTYTFKWKDCDEELQN
tara:strand:- start:343 stop:753 length:411 start_codon:yes stop_codon:yes gene_type:complete